MKSESLVPIRRADIPASLTPARHAFLSPIAGLSRKQLAIEVGVRVSCVALLSVFLASSLVQFARDPSRITLLLLAVAELLTVGLAAFTRVPRERDWNPLSVVMASSASFYFLAFRIEPGIRLVPETLAAGFQIAGILIQISAKLSLRRSFGILPANRGVVIRGPYRFLRHPMYFGYLVSDIGFILPNFGIQNLIVFVVHWMLQFGRIVQEERLLSKDASYREYMSRVRYRLIRGVF
jgi:protein-S-isoprenylcysteine O-methyltransferase Ste14